MESTTTTSVESTAADTEDNKNPSSKKTVVLGASPNPDRYSYKAVTRLTQHGHEVVAVGTRKGEINGIEIQQGQPEIQGVHTLTLYIGPENQPPSYDYILSLHPRRIIFNPGTENPELMRLAKQNGIEVVQGCTLVMLAIDVF